MRSILGQKKSEILENYTTTDQTQNSMLRIVITKIDRNRCLKRNRRLRNRSDKILTKFVFQSILRALLFQILKTKTLRMCNILRVKIQIKETKEGNKGKR